MQLRRSRRTSRLLLRFSLISLVLVLAIGVVLSGRLRSAVRDRTLADAARTAEVVAAVGVQPLLDPADLQQDFLPLDRERVATLDRSLSGSASDGSGVVRLKLWNRQHWIVYSSNPLLTGRWFAGNDLLAAAFDGRTVSEVTDLTAPEELEERDFGQLLAVYVPLRTGADGSFTTADDPDATVVGAFEIYLPYAPIAAAIADDARELTIALAVGLTVLWLALFRLVAAASSRLRRQARENEYLATHDALTGLPNRRLFAAHVDEMLAEAPADERVALVLAGVDRFQDVNDTLGHAVGDEVLRILGTRLTRFLDEAPAGGRARDVVVGRIGGDELAVAARGVRSRVDLHVLADLVVEALGEAIEVAGISLSVHASLGIAHAPEHGVRAEDLLRRADVAMHHAKRSHTGRTVYDPALDHHSPERLALAGELRHAMEDGQLRLVYQPKVDLRTGEVSGVEALVRWHHPERGLVPPGEFLPVVEPTELVGPLTRHLLDIALTQARAWIDAGEPLHVAVNLSARVLADRSLPRWVEALLERHGVPAALLELELTESAVLADPEAGALVLQELHEMGVTLSIDDFGTGYASLGYLTGLPIDVLKIDRSFAGFVTTDEQARAVVSFTVALARELGLRTVAEGVEDAPTLELLRTLGCDDAQGYLLAKPLPPADLDAWLASRAALVAAS